MSKRAGAETNGAAREALRILGAAEVEALLDTAMCQADRVRARKLLARAYDSMTERDAARRADDAEAALRRSVARLKRGGRA